MKINYSKTPRIKDFQKRVLELDPSEIYKRIIVDRYVRIQSIPMSDFFPKINGICGCGCGEKLQGRRTRWFSDECQYFAVAVQGIINGHPDYVSTYLSLINPDWACCNCGVMNIYKEYKNGLAVNAIHKDHIVAVKNGGGGCWLDNYQLLCDTCHSNKTKQDVKVISINRISENEKKRITDLVINTTKSW